MRSTEIATAPTAGAEAGIISVVPYETRLKGDFDWALREASMYFEDGGAVQKTLRQVTNRLEELGVPYAVAGGLALFYHGYQRFTQDVDILVTKESLKLIHDKLEGRGYLPPFTGSKHLRDTSTGVKVEFLTTGEFPGDGKPKPVAFPDPAVVRVEVSGMWFLRLPTLVELKLASGMTSVHRGKDIVDVQALIREMNLGEDFAEQLDLYVREKFLELVRLFRDNPVPPE